MSYREENGKIILTQTPEEFGNLLFLLGVAAGDLAIDGEDIAGVFKLLNSLNEGNPNYRPRQVEVKKS